jgi:ABC-type multidrug transport system fused ATPase/permease subunit
MIATDSGTARGAICASRRWQATFERVVGDIRPAVFDQVIALSPAYFEVHRTGDIMSRLTTDTTLLQTVIGSTVSQQALRNALLLVGGLAMLAVTSIKLTLLVLLIVPVVVVPILFYGRRVRRLSRDSQDAIAAFGAYAEETINAIRTVQAFTHEAMDRAPLRGACRNGVCRSTTADRGACRAHRDLFDFATLKRRCRRILLLARVGTEHPAVGFSQPRGQADRGPGEGVTSEPVLWDPNSLLAGKLQ